MAFRINTNVDAANANRNLGLTQGLLSHTLQQLASGRRINSAADDAAGLAISEILTSQVRGTNQAVRNAQDAISLVQTADGALNQTSDALQRIRELTVQAGNGTLSASQRNAIQSEVSSLQQSIDQVAGGAQFNGQPLLTGTTPNVQLQTGANTGASNTTTVALPTATAAGLGVAPGQIDLSSPAAANASLAQIDQAIGQVSSARGNLGAQSSALENLTASLNVSSENHASARSRIQDLDFAQALTQRTRDQILSNAGVAVLAQANFSSQSVLRLLG